MEERRETWRKKERRERKERREKELREDGGAADIVFHGGNIYTIDDSNPKVEALEIEYLRLVL